ncbi:hypothetical protein JMJ35_007740 [Cladonia borealis]|uniref:Uncharacterized protein n=1 Tax=Cladonia borealis TaxID=184061 RepID=A0AA39QWX4_9LECA|nr:hypothetical protein JMJ35_007740 [Cladonia borealis]
MSYGKPRGKASHEIAKTPYTQKSQQPPTPPSDSGPGRTSYFSANKQDNSTFIADAPANSQHAARLMKIAMLNQPQYGKSEKLYQKRLEGKGQQQRRLTSQGEPVQGDITKSSRSRLATTMSHENGINNSQGYPPPSGYPPSTSGYPPTTGYPPPSTYPPPSSSLIPQQSTPYAPPSLPSVYRYEDNGKVTYHQVAPSGDLKISAPVDSLEAQEMEHAAAKLCKPRHHNDNNGYVDDYEDEDDGGDGRQLVTRGARGTGQRKKGGGKKERSSFGGKY